MDKSVNFLNVNICYVFYVLLWIKYWVMWFESLLVFILFKYKKNSPFPEFGLYIIQLYCVEYWIPAEFLFLAFWLAPVLKPTTEYEHQSSHLNDCAVSKVWNFTLWQCLCSCISGRLSICALEGFFQWLSAGYINTPEGGDNQLSL